MQKKFPDMTDEQLDKIFRDAARQYNPPSAPKGAWEEFIQNREKAQQGGSLGTDNEGKETNWKKITFFRQRRFWLIVAAAIVLFCLGIIGIWQEMGESRSTDNRVLVTKGETTGGDYIGREVAPARHKKVLTESAFPGKNGVIKGEKLAVPSANNSEAGT